MEGKKNPDFKSPIIPWIIGFATIVFFIMMGWETYKYIDFKTHSKNGKALIVGYSSDGTGNVLWEYDYIVNGKKYRYSDYKTSAKNSDVGDTVNIKYNFKHPEKSILTEN